MTRTIQHSALGLSLVLLLAACGGSTPDSGLSSTTQPPAASGGFTVDGKSNAAQRKVTLPAPAVMPLPVARSLGAQAVSSLPAWTGPRLFEGDTYRNTFATNKAGELFVGQTVESSQNVPGRFSKFSATGQTIGSKVFDIAGSGSEQYGSRWLVVTEGQPERETYQIGTNNAGQLQAQIYDTSADIFNEASEPIFPMTFPNQVFYGINPFTANIRAKGKDLVISSVNFKGFNYLTDASVPVYEAGYEPWGEIGLRVSNIIRPPSQYKDNFTGSDFAVGSDGSVYLAVFTCTTRGRNFRFPCTAVAGITKFTGEDIAWQVYWDTDRQVSFQNIVVSDDAVSVMVAADDTTDAIYGGNPANSRSIIQTFSLDGDPISNRILPKIFDGTVLNGLKMDASGKMVGYTSNYILTGTQSEGFTKYLDLKDEYGISRESTESNYIKDVTFSGAYLYAVGRTSDGLGNPGNPPPRPDTDVSPASDPAGDFILPLDFSLNRRF